MNVRPQTVQRSKRKKVKILTSGLCFPRVISAKLPIAQFVRVISSGGNRKVRALLACSCCERFTCCFSLHRQGSCLNRTTCKCDPCFSTFTDSSSRIATLQTSLKTDHFRVWCAPIRSVRSTPAVLFISYT